jgi:hypothetical protein
VPVKCISDRPGDVGDRESDISLEMELVDLCISACSGSRTEELVSRCLRIRAFSSR